MHRLVQDFARRSMTEERRGEALREALGWVNAAFRRRSARRPELADPRPARAARAGGRQARRTRRRSLSRLRGFSIGLLCCCQAKARYAEAEPLFRRALAIGEASLGPDHPSVATCLNNLASLLHVTNRVTKPSRSIGGRWRSMRRATGRTMLRWRETSTISLSCSGTRTDSARPSRFIGARLAIDEASYGPDHPEVAIRLNNLAILLRDMNRLGEAEPLFRRALAIDEASYRAGSSRRGERPQQSRGIARVPRTGSREAEPLFRRALAIFEASYGPDYPIVAAGLNNLAELLRATNRLGEAEPHYRRALAISETRATGQIIRTSRPASIISRSCLPRRTASARPSRFFAARWRSTRRTTGRIIPTSPQTSTISHSCFRPRTACKRRSRFIAAR